ncbi:MAG: Gfo/Idh/MocA family protein [Spirochaetaceae bacterium]
MDTVRWGVLSTATIATRKVIPAMQGAEHVEVAAIASRDEGRARKVARELGIDRAYGTYETLLSDPEIDAVYIPLPNHLHVQWSITALEAGKHVLCEKPIGLSVAEAEKLRDAGRRHPKLKLMEAFMYRHHPQWVKAKELVDDGHIGTLKAIQSFFSYHNADPTDIRNQADIGGGGLMDIGCYPISVSRFLFGGEPNRVAATIEIDPTFRTDTSGTAILEFEGGTSAFTYGTLLEPFQRVNIFGTDGRIEVVIPFNAPPDRPCSVNLQQHGEVREIKLDTADQYQIQGELMSQAILNDTPVPTPIDDAVANMRVIERCFAASREGTWQ